MKKFKKITKQVESGFTLIEVMISLLIFATGMLGVAFQMSQGIKNTINTEIHSSVMQVVLQTIEPLGKSILNSNSAFITELKNIQLTPPFAGASTQGNFSITVDNAKDEDNNSLLGAEPAGKWQGPFTVVLKVTYTILDTSTSLDFYTTHVLVPKLPT